MRISVFVAAIVAVASITAWSNMLVCADDQIIYQRVVNGQAAGTASVIQNVGFSFCVSKPGTKYGDGAWIDLFSIYRFTNQSVGALVSIDASNDPNFATVTNILTNGTNEEVILTVNWFAGPGTSLGGSGPESYFFHDDLVGSVPNDLQGYQINRIDLKVNSIHLDVPGYDPNHNGNWTDVSADLTFTFFGTAVPEPSTIALLAIGAIGLLIARRKAAAR